MIMCGTSFAKSEHCPKRIRSREDVRSIELPWLLRLASTHPSLRSCVGLQSSGSVKISGFENPFPYSASFNKNDRTIEKFSTGADINFRPGSDLEEDYYPFFRPYVEYYGTYDFAHQVSMAGFTGAKTGFDNGNIDLTGYGYTARARKWNSTALRLNFRLSLTIPSDLQRSPGRRLRT